ncbi:hypothetical protein OG753_26710 [Streptomyces sp. NBC_00029]|uniref:hypothetical protein n=1 Tax=Streptomyces sp. NBC_00029 TaxID=2903613 RepID=UPI00324F47F4
MSDLYAVDLALNLRDSVPHTVLADLRWHLGEEERAVDEELDMYPLLASRGPAVRIGGVRVAELARTAGGWALTVRYEIHAEVLPDFDSLVERLVRHSDTEGHIGQIRFHEEYVPELLINRSGTLTRLPLTPKATPQ